MQTVIERAIEAMEKRIKNHTEKIENRVVIQRFKRAHSDWQVRTGHETNSTNHRDWQSGSGENSTFIIVESDTPEISHVLETSNGTIVDFINDPVSIRAFDDPRFKGWGETEAEAWEMAFEREQDEKG